MMYRVLGPLASVWLTVSAFTAEAPAPGCDLWNGHESIPAYAKRVNLPPVKTLDLGNGVSMDFNLIPSGKFIMGTPVLTSYWIVIICLDIGVLIVLGLVANDLIRAVRQHRRTQYWWLILFVGFLGLTGYIHFQYWEPMKRLHNIWLRESPAHEVILSRPFFSGKYLVSQEQYQQVMGTNPAYFTGSIGSTNPVEMVSWHDAQYFCKKLSEITGKIVRLPTEAEWEYACRAGTTTKYYSGDNEEDLARAAWYSSNSNNTTHSVGQKEPNAWGLYDMHGNVFEWCQDWWGEKYYEGSPIMDPRGPESGDERVLRGGSFIESFLNCRSAYRKSLYPGSRFPFMGFRVVLVARTP